MKKILLLFFGIILITLTSFYFSKNEMSGHGGRCTGSAYCTACSNCSRCGHCGAGGTCGVCSGSSSGRNFNNTSTNKKSKNSKKSYLNSNNSTSSYSTSRYTKTETINVRKGPGFHFNIIEKIKQNSNVTVIEKKNNWVKVQIKKTGTTGYIYYKDVK